MADIVPIDPYGAFLANENLQSQIAGRQALTDEQILSTRIKRDAFGRMQDYLGQAAALTGQQGTAAQPGKDFPDASAETGQPTAPKTPSLWEIQAQRANEQDALSVIAQKTGQPELANKHRDDARLYRADAEKAQKTQLEASRKIQEDIARAAGFMMNPDTFYFGLQQAKDLAKAQGVPFDQLPFDKDLDGNIRPSERNFKVAEAFANQSMQRKDQIELQLKAEDVVRKGENLERLRERDREIAAYREQLIAAQQGRQDARAAEIQAKLDALEARGARNKAKDAEAVNTHVQGNLNKIGAYNTFDRYNQSYSMVKNISEELKGSKDPYEVLTGPRADALKQAYVQMSHAYRSRDPGKWADQNIQKAANGVFQNIEKYASTLGTGTPSISRDGALKMADAMSDLYALTAAESFASEAEARRIAKRRGGDPEGIAIKAYTPAVRQLLVSRGLLKPKFDSKKELIGYEVAGREFKLADTEADE